MTKPGDAFKAAQTAAKAFMKADDDALKKASGLDDKAKKKLIDASEKNRAALLSMLDDATAVSLKEIGRYKKAGKLPPLKEIKAYSDANLSKKEMGPYCDRWGTQLMNYKKSASKKLKAGNKIMIPDTFGTFAGDAAMVGKGVLSVDWPLMADRLG